MLATACLSIQGPGCHAGDVQSTEATLIVSLLVSLLVSILVFPQQLAQALDPPHIPTHIPNHPCPSVSVRVRPSVNVSSNYSRRRRFRRRRGPCWLWPGARGFAYSGSNEAPCWGGTEAKPHAGFAIYVHSCYGFAWDPFA